MARLTHRKAQNDFASSGQSNKGVASIWLYAADASEISRPKRRNGSRTHSRTHIRRWERVKQSGLLLTAKKKPRQF